MPTASNERLKSISIDCVIFGFNKNHLQILLIKRPNDPQKGQWALPGGFINEDENLDDSAQRILSELTGVNNIFMDQVHTFGAVDRYPLRRVITINYFALVKSANFTFTPSEETAETAWFPISEISNLPFDHNKIVDYSLNQLRRKIKHTPIGFELLPKKFSLTELQALYETILGKELDKRNFRKKFIKMNLLVDLKEKQTKVAHRAASLYKFDDEIYHSMKEKGFNFDI